MLEPAVDAVGELVDRLGLVAGRSEVCDYFEVRRDISQLVSLHWDQPLVYRVDTEQEAL